MALVEITGQPGSAAQPPKAAPRPTPKASPKPKSLREQGVLVNLRRSPSAKPAPVTRVPKGPAKDAEWDTLVKAVKANAAAAPVVGIRKGPTAPMSVNLASAKWYETQAAGEKDPTEKARLEANAKHFYAEHEARYPSHLPDMDHLARENKLPADATGAGAHAIGGGEQPRVPSGSSDGGQWTK